MTALPPATSMAPSGWSRGAACGATFHVLLLLRSHKAAATRVIRPTAAVVVDVVTAAAEAGLNKNEAPAEGEGTLLGLVSRSFTTLCASTVASRLLEVCARAALRALERRRLAVLRRRAALPSCSAKVAVVKSTPTLAERGGAAVTPVMKLCCCCAFCALKGKLNPLGSETASPPGEAAPSKRAGGGAPPLPPLVLVLPSRIPAKRSSLREMPKDARSGCTAAVTSGLRSGGRGAESETSIEKLIAGRASASWASFVHAPKNTWSSGPKPELVIPPSQLIQKESSVRPGEGSPIFH